jgi:hypothetical protein
MALLGTSETFILNHLTPSNSPEDKEFRNILLTIQRRKANWADHILLKNCLQKQVPEAKLKRRTEVTEKQGRRHKQLLHELKKMRG